MAQYSKMKNIAVIGAGRWGPNHVRNFSAQKNCQVVAVADPREEALARIRANFTYLRAYKDYADILDMPDVDAVVVAVPTSLHYQVVRDALTAGKNVLCEKPLTSKSADAWELVDLAEKMRLQLMVGHVFLFNPGIAYLLQAAREHALGPLYYVSAVRTNLGPFRSDVNAAWDLASHDIYIFNAILDSRPVAVSAVGASYLSPPVEDLAFLTMQYANGSVAHAHASWLDPKKVRQITLVGEKKMITWDEFGVPAPIMVFNRSVVREPVYNSFGEFQLLTREGDVMIPHIPPKEPLAAQAVEFVARLHGTSNDLVRGSARQGAEVVDILMAASRSMLSHGAMQEVEYGR